MASKDENGVYWMSVHDAAKRLGTTGEHVVDMIQRGAIVGVRRETTIAGVRYRIPSTSIENMEKFLRHG